MAGHSPFKAVDAVPAGAGGPALLESEQGSADMSMLSPARSVMQKSEAQLMQRCTEEVQKCQRSLEELRAVCKAANAHREKCAELLGAASRVVYELSEMLYDPKIDIRRERKLYEMANETHLTIDEGETVARVYGSLNGMSKLFSKMCSPGTLDKFDACISKLSNLGKQARLVREQPVAATRLQGQAAAAASPQQTWQQGLQLTPTHSGSTYEPPSPASGSASASVVAAAAAHQQQQQRAGLAGSGGGEQQPPPAQSPFVQEDSLAGLAAGGGSYRAIAEDAMQARKLHKGARGHRIPAIVFIPPSEEQRGRELGHLWYYLSKGMFKGSMFVYDLSGGIEAELAESRSDPAVACLHYDEANPLMGALVWVGHRNGNVRVWSADRRVALLDSVKVFNSGTVTAITTDEHGHAWVASDKGKVRCYRLEAVEVDGASLGIRLVLKGELNSVPEGMPPPDYSSCENVNGMITTPLAKDPAHYGPVRCILAAVGRVWTCGGSSAFASFKEWTQSGIQLGSQSMRSMDSDSPGLINHMRIISPIVTVQVTERVQVQAPPSSVLGSFSGGTALGSTVSRLTTAVQLVELTQIWQLLTVHDSGMVQVWGHIDQRLQPLIRIGDRVAPALRVIVVEPMGALITAHNDGRLRMRALPHPNSPGGFKVTWQEGSVSKIPDAALPAVVMETSKTGLADAVGGDLGVITVSNYGSIKIQPASELRALAADAGLGVQSPMSSQEQWPVVCYSSAGLQKLLMDVQLMLQQRRNSLDFSLARGVSSTMADEAGGGSGGPGLPDGSKSEVAVRERSSFLPGGNDGELAIEWKDISRIRIIGEGAFGKVWLGRWQETDVAVKQLGSLSALGVETGSLQHDSSGGVKLDKDVQRALEREVTLMHSMRHPNIVLFMGVVLDPPAVVMEFCARGSLYDLLKSARNNQTLAKQLDWGRRIMMALDAAKGMTYLHGHKPPIIHRDLKSPNLLVEKSWRVKVTDFNLSRASEASAVASSVTANNPRWQPPEVISRQQFSKASDVYAFGLILWELLTWQLPFADLSNFQIMLAVTQQGKRPPVPDQYEAAQLPGGAFSGYDAYVSLMQRCWADDPADRPTFEQVIAELRRVAAILAGTRANATRPGGPVLLQSQSRNFARLAQGAVAGLVPSASPSPEPGATPPLGAAAPAPAAAPASPFDVASNVSSAAAVSVGPVLVDSAYMPPPQQPISSNTVAAPSPFGGGGGFTPPVSSNAAAIPSPFGGGPPVPPPGPFTSGGSPFDAPATQTQVSNAPPVPSPFGGGGGALPAVGSAAAAGAPPSPFGGAIGGGSVVGSSTVPPPSPFDTAPKSVAVCSSSAAVGAAPHLSPFAARATGDLAPPAPGDSSDSYHPRHLGSVPSTVLEATPSTEAAAAAPSGTLPPGMAPPPSEPAGAASTATAALYSSDSAEHLSGGPNPINRDDSPLVDSALTASAGHMPRGSSAPNPSLPAGGSSQVAGSAGPSNASSELKTRSYPELSERQEQLQQGNGSGSTNGSAGLMRKLRQSLSGGRRLNRMQTR